MGDRVATKSSTRKDGQIWKVGVLYITALKF